MRRVVSVSVLVLFGLTACTAPVPGADGNLVNGWSGMAPVEQFVPADQTCHTARQDVITYTAYEPIECTDSHAVETVFVGEFSGAAAEGAAPPSPETKDAAAAFKVCDTKATELVGRQWRDLSLELFLAIPSNTAWAGGARWFRCDLAQITDVSDSFGGAVPRTGSLRSIEDSSLKLGCFNYRSGGRLDPVECTASHNAEYVGTIFAPDKMTYPAKTKDWDPLYDRCWAQAGRYIGISDARYKVGLHIVSADSDVWAGGDRGVRCFLWLNKGKMTKSAEDTNGKGLNYQD